MTQYEIDKLRKSLTALGLCPDAVEEAVATQANEDVKLSYKMVNEMAEILMDAHESILQACVADAGVCSHTKEENLRHIASRAFNGAQLHEVAATLSSMKMAGFASEIDHQGWSNRVNELNATTIKNTIIKLQEVLSKLEKGKKGKQSPDSKRKLTESQLKNYFKFVHMIADNEGLSVPMEDIWILHSKVTHDLTVPHLSLLFGSSRYNNDAKRFVYLSPSFVKDKLRAVLDKISGCVNFLLESGVSERQISDWFTTAKHQVCISKMEKGEYSWE